MILVVQRLIVLPLMQEVILNFNQMQDDSFSSSAQKIADAIINNNIIEIPTTQEDMSHSGISKRKSTLTTQSKDLLLKLDQLKKEMQKNIVNPNNTSNHHIKPASSRVNETALSSNNARETTSPVLKISEKKEHSKINQIRENIIGFNTRFISPFNIELETVYVDHTATNRPYQKVEAMIEFAKKFIANPHTEFSHFGKFSTEMMHYAHDSLLRSFSADPLDFVALPTGSGSTGAIQKTIKIIKSLQIQSEKPTIFITPYEHHSNILPWVEFYDDINVLESDQQGNLLMDKIQAQLTACPAQNIIVTVSAASNVTSTMTDLLSLNTVIKKIKQIKNCIFAADCAAYCCHHELNLKKLDQLDFAYLSPHKNLGGAQACGVLIARKNIVKNAKPTFPGGGTVAFVKGYTKTDVMYDVNIFNRQIAGTPPFLGFYRAALSFQLLKNDIGYDFIHQCQKRNTQRFIQLLNDANAKFKQEKSNNHIVIYGDSDFSKRANVFTFNIISKGQIVQHNLVSLILADVFGIQLRSGCFCAGPFGMRLLKLDETTVGSIEQEVSVGILKAKPGYLRLDLTFYLQLYQIQYIANAIIGLTKYSKNMELVYTLCNDGEIKRHKLFKNVINDKYSLQNASFAKEFVKKDDETHHERLQKRKITLQKQLSRGLNIVMKPIQFLKTQIHS